MRGALGSAVSQGIGVATGLQSRFDFAGVAAAAIGTAAGAKVTARLGDGFGATLAANTASGIANAATRSALSGSSFGDNLMRALPDVIGQTVGGYAARQLARSRGASAGDSGAQRGEAGAMTGNIAIDLDNPALALSRGGASAAPLENEVVVTGSRGSLTATSDVAYQTRLTAELNQNAKDDAAASSLPRRPVDDRRNAITLDENNRWRAGFEADRAADRAAGRRYDPDYERVIDESFAYRQAELLGLQPGIDLQLGIVDGFFSAPIILFGAAASLPAIAAGGLIGVSGWLGLASSTNYGLGGLAGPITGQAGSALSQIPPTYGRNLSLGLDALALTSGLAATGRALLMRPGLAIAAENGPTIIEGIDASTLVRSHPIGGRSSTARVDDIAASMRSNGYVGDSIKVIQSDGRMIIVDGHHRAVAASRTGTPVNVQVVGPESFPMGSGGWQSIDQAIQASQTAGPNRLNRPRR